MFTMSLGKGAASQDRAPYKTRQIRQNSFNGECGSSRDASVYGDDAKSKIPS
jgi:hypothetical protein